MILIFDYLFTDSSESGENCDSGEYGDTNGSGDSCKLGDSGDSQESDYF